MVYSMPKSKLEPILDVLSSESNNINLAIDTIVSVLRGNNDSYKLHHIVEEVWSLKETLKHFSNTKPVGVIKEGNIILTSENVSENTKLYPLPANFLTADDIQYLKEQLSKQEGIKAKTVSDKLDMI